RSSDLLNQNKKYPSYLETQKGIFKAFHFAIPAILIFTIYYAFRMEIATYWNQLYTDSAIKINSDNQQYPDYYWNNDLRWFKSIWIINYSLRSEEHTSELQSRENLVCRL